MITAAGTQISDSGWGRLLPLLCLPTSQPLTPWRNLHTGRRLSYSPTLRLPSGTAQERRFPPAACVSVNVLVNDGRLEAAGVGLGASERIHQSHAASPGIDKTELHLAKTLRRAQPTHLHVLQQENLRIPKGEVSSSWLQGSC